MKKSSHKMKKDPLHLQILAWDVYLVTVPMPTYAYSILSPFMTLIFSRNNFNSTRTKGIYKLAIVKPNA